jgi:hypothetical protein
MSFEVIPPDEDLFGDRATRIRASEATGFGCEVFPVNRELVAFEIGFQVEGTRADGA